MDSSPQATEASSIRGTVSSPLPGPPVSAASLSGSERCFGARRLRPRKLFPEGSVFFEQQFFSFPFLWLSSFPFSPPSRSLFPPTLQWPAPPATGFQNNGEHSFLFSPPS